MNKKIAIALAGIALVLGAGSARAGSNINWSVGISAPAVGAVISGAPAYGAYGAPVYVQQSPVYVPAPVYYQPRPIYYHPAPVYYGPPRAYYPPPVYRPRGWGHGHNHGGWDRGRHGPR